MDLFGFAIGYRAFPICRSTSTASLPSFSCGFVCHAVSHSFQRATYVVRAPFSLSPRHSLPFFCCIRTPPFSLPSFLTRIPKGVSAQPHVPPLRCRAFPPPAFLRRSLILAVLFFPVLIVCVLSSSSFPPTFSSNTTHSPPADLLDRSHPLFPIPHTPPAHKSAHLSRLRLFFFLPTPFF